MCNFVPGECHAFGLRKDINEVETGDLPGRVEILPLQYTEEGRESPFANYGFVRVTEIPHGLELETVSRLSALLANPIRNRRAVAELNYLLPKAMPRVSPMADGELSDLAIQWATMTRSIAANVGVPTAPAVALIDSGVNVRSIRGRSLTRLDFSNGAPGNPAINESEPNGHGTRVARVLHESLPPAVPIISAKIGDTDDEVTVLGLCRAFAETVARFQPAVVNISLAPFDDTYTCPRCGEPVKTPAFHSAIIRRVFSLANRSFVVMAAGNERQSCNQRLIDDGVENLVFAVAVGSRGGKTRYSASPSGPDSQHLAVLAFGGDDLSSKHGLGVFQDDRKAVGTSFAAPFVTAGIYPAAAQLSATGNGMTRNDVLRPMHHQSGLGWIPNWIPRAHWRDWRYLF